MTGRLAALLVAVGAAASCGGGDRDRGAAMGPSAGGPTAGDAGLSPTTGRRPLTSTPVPGEPVLVVTEQHDGARLPAVAGAVVTVQLDDARVWTPLVARGPADVVPVQHESDPGHAGWEVRLHGPGEVVLTSRGAPACSSCPPPLDLDVVLDVRSG